METEGPMPYSGITVPSHPQRLRRMGIRIWLCTSGQEGVLVLEGSKLRAKKSAYFSKETLVVHNAPE